MQKWLDNFAVRMSRRLHENRGKVCPSCGENDPLLILKNGYCANCASDHTEEEHHLLGRAFRKSPEDEQLLIPVSPNAHRLLSDLQAGHPTPVAADPSSPSFEEGWMWELLVSLADLWFVLTYMHEKPEMVKDIPMVMLLPLLGVILMNLHRIDLHKWLADAKEALYAKQL